MGGEKKVSKRRELPPWFCSPLSLALDPLGSLAGPRPAGSCGLLPAPARCLPTTWAHGEELLSPLRGRSERKARPERKLQRRLGGSQHEKKKSERRRQVRAVALASLLSPSTRLGRQGAPSLRSPSARRSSPSPRALVWELETRILRALGALSCDSAAAFLWRQSRKTNYSFSCSTPFSCSTSSTAKLFPLSIRRPSLPLPP